MLRGHSITKWTRWGGQKQMVQKIIVHLQEKRCLRGGSSYKGKIMSTQFLNPQQKIKLCHFSYILILVLQAFPATIARVCSRPKCYNCANCVTEWTCQVLFFKSIYSITFLTAGMNKTAQQRTFSIVKPKNVCIMVTAKKDKIEATSILKLADLKEL